MQMNQIPLAEKKNKSALAMQDHKVSKVYIFSNRTISWCSAAMTLKLNARNRSVFFVVEYN